ncbi:MAG: ribonuclease HI [Bacteroidales bacterium]|nr:ribonuclease HI [Bacteroidales bacterium]
MLDGLANTENIISIYTDGAARGNPGPGGYGAVLLWKNHKKEIAKGFRHTTNNRMELLAVIEALKLVKIPNSDIIVYSDSKYVVEAVEQKWLFDWERIKFKKKKNPDLWLEFLKLYRKHNVKLQWVKGHSDNEYNNRCDQLAVWASKNDNTNIDKVYEELDQDLKLDL